MGINGIGGAGILGTVLEGVKLQARGDSTFVVPPYMAQPGGTIQERLQRRLGMGTLTTYAAIGSRMVETYFDAADTVQAASAGAIAGSVIGVNNTGVYLIAGPTNDWTNPTGGSNYAPANPSANKIANVTDSLLAVMALISASARVETNIAGTATGVWTTSTAVNGFSGKDQASTTSATGTAHYDVPVTFTASGRCWHVGYTQTFGMAPVSIAVDGVIQWAYTPPVWESEFSGRGTTTTYGYGPSCKMVKAPAGAHTCTITKTDTSGATILYSDVWLPVAANPPLIVVEKYALPYSAGVTNPYLSAQNIADMLSSQATWNAAIDNAVAQFPNAVVADCSILTGRQSQYDGVHPGDRMMKERADIYQAAMMRAAQSFTAGINLV